MADFWMASATGGNGPRTNDWPRNHAVASTVKIEKMAPAMESTWPPVRSRSSRRRTGSPRA
jgi:hypothetical protein